MRQRRLMNQINVVPYIDVMLVLLVIFMVTAPMIQSGSVNLPSVDKVPAPPTDAMIVTVKPQGELTLSQTSQAQPKSYNRRDLIGAVQDAVSANPGQPVVIAADKGARYDDVLGLLDLLQRNGVRKVGLLAKPPAS